ncbi:MAG TPA: PQQ-binding-like beta-propeller repeat protein [Gemmatimonadales bacterium]|nr:PQQ-binding-like beta-propeller repeat protein [Gemmatimonadales bacterium]
MRTGLFTAIPLLLSAHLGTATLAGQGAPRDPIEGKWSGSAGTSLDRVGIAFEFKRDSSGQIRAFLYQSVINFYGLELPGVLTREGAGYVLPAYKLSLTPRGDSLTGTLYGTNVPVSLTRTNTLPHELPVPRLPPGPGPRWQTKLGAPIYAAVALQDGVAYVGTSGGMFYAIDQSSGAFVWAFAAGRPIFGAAAATDSAVYFVCDNGYLFKLNRRTGQEAWHYDLGDGQVSRILAHQVIENSGDFDFDTSSPTPTLVDGVIYVGSGDGSMHAVDAGSGQRIWRAEAKGKIRGTAVVAGSRVMFGTFDGLVYALDRRSGAELWKKERFGPIVTSTGLVADKLIVGSRYGLLAGLDTATGTSAWRMQLWGSSAESEAEPAGGSLFLFGSSDLRRVSLMDAKDGRVLWRTDVFGWAWPRPVLVNDLIFVSTVGGEPYQMRHLAALSALDRKTGRILWRWPMPETPGAWTYGFIASPVVSGALVVVGGLDGSLYGFPVR